MKGKIKLFLFGSLFGYTALNTLNLVYPQRTLKKCQKQLIDNYISQHKLKTFILPHLWSYYYSFFKGFLNYGLLYKMQGFKIRKYYIKQQQNNKNINCLFIIFSPSANVCDNSKFQSPGVSATIIDDSMGCLCNSFSQKVVATVKLDLQYIKPILKDQYYVLELFVKEKDGRQMFLNGKVKNLLTNQQVINSDGLFYTVDWKSKSGFVGNLIMKYFFYPLQTQNFKAFTQNQVKQ